MTGHRPQMRRAVRRLVAGALAAVAVSASPPVSAPVAGETVPDVIRALNEIRQERGLRGLTRDPEVTKAAAHHVADMVEQGYVGVRAPDGTDAGAWLRRAGVRTPEFSAVAVSGLPDHIDVPTALLRAPAMADLLLAPGDLRIGVARHEQMFRLADGRLTSEAWSVIAARPDPPAIVDAVPELLREINRSRARRGAGPVRLNPRLSQAAAMQADDMTAYGYVGHGRPGGPRLIDRIETAGYAFSRVAENAAAGQESPLAAVEAWESSPAHARTLYAEEFDEVGLAYRKGPIPDGALSMPHVWVAVFGAR